MYPAHTSIPICLVVSHLHWSTINTQPYRDSPKYFQESRSTVRRFPHVNFILRLVPNGVRLVCTGALPTRIHPCADRCVTSCFFTKNPAEKSKPSAAPANASEYHNEENLLRDYLQHTDLYQASQSAPSPTYSPSIQGGQSVVPSRYYAY